MNNIHYYGKAINLYLDTESTTHAPAEYPTLREETVDRPLRVQEDDIIFVCSIDGIAAEGFSLIHSQSTTESASHKYNLNTWWKRATANEPESYTFPGAKGLWAVRISGAADLPAAVAGHAEPPPGWMSPLGIQTPSVNTLVPNCLVIRISSNNMYPTTTESEQWIQWPLNQFPCFAASWKIQEAVGPTGEEYHGTGSFIHWVAQTIAIAPCEDENNDNDNGENNDNGAEPIPPQPSFQIEHILSIILTIMMLGIVTKMIK